MEKPKRIKTSIPLTKKLEIIQMANEAMENGISQRQIAKSLALSRTTLAGILKNKNKIQKRLEENPNTKSTILSNKRDSRLEILEDKLLIWLNEKVGLGDQLNENCICSKASWMWKEEHEEKYKFSKGWFDGFCRRKQVRLLKCTGESALVDKEKVKDFVNKIENIIKDGEYSRDQIFNVDELGLYWKRRTGRTYAGMEHSKVPGYKKDNSMVTILLGANASGTFKLKPVLIYKCENPHALKNKNRTNLPVIYRWNKKSCWMTKELFSEWFHNHFIPEVKDFLAKRNLPFKVLLLLDNSPVHQTNLQCDKVRIEFLPPDTSCVLQPMDQSVIKTFKDHYQRNVCYEAFELQDKKIISNSQEFFKDFQIDKCIDHVGKAWDEIEESTLRKAWKKVLPSLQNEEQFHKIDKQIEKDENFNFILNTVDNIIEHNYLNSDEIDSFSKNVQNNSQNMEKLENDGEVHDFEKQVTIERNQTSSSIDVDQILKEHNYCKPNIVN